MQDVAIYRASHNENVHDIIKSHTILNSLNDLKVSA